MARTTLAGGRSGLAPTTAGARGMLPRLRSGLWQVAPELAVMTAATLFLFREFLQTGWLVSTGDLSGSIYPLLDFGAAEMRAGRLPTWSPFAGGGLSLMGGAVPTFYPLSFLFLILPSSLAVGWSYILAVLVAGTGTYFFGRQLGLSRWAGLLSAVSLMFSGYLFNRLFAGHFGSILTMVWLPWVLLFAERAIVGRFGTNVALGGLAMGIHFLAATASEYVYVVVALLLYAPLRALFSSEVLPIGGVSGFSTKGATARLIRAFAAVVLIFAIAAALAAPVILPLREVVAYSVRSGGLSYYEATLGSLSPAHLLAFFIRNLYGIEADGTGWFGGILHETTGYVGVLPLVLAIIAVVRRPGRAAPVLIMLGAFALLASLGQTTPFYQLLHSVSPFNLVRVPPRFLWLYVFAAAMLAGFGYDILRAASSAALAKLSRRLVFSALLVLFAIGIMAVGLQLIPFPPGMEAARGVIPWILARSGLTTALILIAGAGLVYRRSRGLGDGYLSAGLIAVVLVDLLSFDQPLLKVNDPGMVYSANRTAAFLRDRPGLYRTMDLGRTLTPYLGNLDRQIQDVESDWALTYLRYWEWIHQDIDHRGGIPGDVRGEIAEYRPQVARLLNVRYVFGNRPLEDPSLTPVTEFVDAERQTYLWPGPEKPSPVWVYEVKDTLPRAFTVHRAMLVPDASSAFRAVADPAFDLRETAVLEEPLEARLPADPPPPREAKIVSYEPARIRVQVEMPADGLLVLNEVNHPGWVARVDGAPVRVLNADFLLRAVYVPAGEHSVEFAYEPESLRVGFLVGAVGAAGVAVYLSYVGWRGIRRQRIEKPIGGRASANPFIR